MSARNGSVNGQWGPAWGSTQVHWGAPLGEPCSQQGKSGLQMRKLLASASRAAGGAPPKPQTVKHLRVHKPSTNADTRQGSSEAGKKDQKWKTMPHLIGGLVERRLEEWKWKENQNNDKLGHKFYEMTPFTLRCDG